MNLNQLEYFAAACAEHNITGAAKRVSISQQTVSSAIAALESELGVKLLVRTPKGVYPTKAGELVLGHASAALAEIDALRASVAALRDGEATCVSFAYMPEVFLSRSNDFAARLVEEFEAAWPATAVKSLACQADACVESVAEGAFDFGFVAQEPANPLVESRTIFECDMGLLVPRSHPLASKTLLTMADLAGHRFPPPPNSSYPILEIVKRCRAHGFEPSFIDLPSGRSFIDTVVEDSHISFVPDGHEAIARLAGEFVFIRFVPEDVIHLCVRAISKKGALLSQRALAFIEFAALRLRATLGEP